MDAAQPLPKHSALFLILTLLALAPSQAMAQATLVAPAGPFQVTSISTVSPAITSSVATTPITFTASVAFASGDPDWLALDGSCVLSLPGLITPHNLVLSIGCNAGLLTLPNVTHTATITVTATSGGTGSGQFIVTYTTNGSGGSGTITPSVNSLVFNALPFNSQSQTFTLNTTSGTPVSFTLSQALPTWLTVTPASGSVASGSPQIIQATANASGFVTGTQLTTNIVFQPGNGTQAITIPVTFNVGTNGGGISFSQNPLNWQYNSNGVFPNSQVSFINSSATYYSYLVNAPPNNWLSVNNSTSLSGSFQFVSSGIFLSGNSNVASLSTGTYTGTVSITDSNGATGTITVNLTVNGGAAAGLTVSPNPVTLTAAQNGSNVTTTVTVTSSNTGTLNAFVTGTGLSITAGASQSVTAGIPVTVTLLGSPAGLSAGTYGGNLNLSGPGGALNVGVTFQVGSGSGGNTGGNVAPTSLSFFYQSGQGAPLSGQLQQFITIASQGRFSISSPTYSSSSGTSAWLAVSQVSGSAPTTNVYVSVNGGVVATMSPGTYSASFVVTDTTTSSSTTVNANLTISSPGVPVLVANPGSVNVSVNAGQTVQPINIQLVSSDNGSATPTPLPVSISTSGTFFTASISGGSTTPTNLTVQMNGTSSLSNGLYSGSITVTTSNSNVVIPIVLLVQGSTTSNGLLSLSPTSMTFSAQVNGSLPPSQFLGVNASTTTNFTASVSTSTGGNWLFISPASGTLATPQNIIVSVSPTGLAQGTYNGAITLTSVGGTQTVPVTLIVGTAAGGNVSVAPTSLTFTGTANGAAPASQTLTVSSASGSAGITYTATATSSSCGNFLSVTPGSGTTQGTLTVSVNPTNLQAGTCNGNITITPTGGSVVSVPVTFIISTPPTISATSTPLSFTFQAGGSTPSPQTISVTGSTSGLTFSASSTMLNGNSGNWLSVTPTTGTAPSTVTVSVSPGSLTAGTYNGNVTIAGTGSAGGTTTIPITLTVTAPLPTITAVVNAATFQSGPVSPGLIVTLGGTAMGPVTPATLTLDSAGKVSTTLAGVTVTFNGFPAPLTYVSATQINCVAPYEIAGIIAPFVQVRYLGQTSNAFALQRAATSPGIFTQNSGGTGPGDILNQNFTVNGPGNPAAKGSTVQVFMTGEGQTSPPGVTGKVTTVNTSGVGPVTPAPLLNVSALVGGQPALVTFAGEAPGLVSGVLQVNVVIPQTVASGSQSISISIGTTSSQPGVTVSVQ
jgi:uncharacterized protein (TIGR03437 family)